MKPKPDVVTLTPAPAIDRTYHLTELARGGTHRSHHSSAELAGKGVNVTRALLLGGVLSRAIVPLSPGDSARWAPDSTLIGSPATHDCRVNITLLEPDGTTTKVNEQAFTLSSSEWEAMTSLALAELGESGSPWLLVAGTIPRQGDKTPADVESLLTAAVSKGCHIALDTSGPALVELARTGLPDFIKPNASELAECVGRPIRSVADVVSAGEEIVGWGVTSVVVSLGPDGIVGINADGSAHAWTGPLDVRNTIGAGDASVAGFLSHQVEHPGDLLGAITRAVLWGAHKVQQPGSQLEHFDSPPEVLATSTPDHDRRLAEPGII